jgi:hypothetical protein
MFTLKLKADIKNNDTARALERHVEDFIDQLRTVDPTLKARMTAEFDSKKEYK